MAAGRVEKMKVLSPTWFLRSYFSWFSWYFSWFWIFFKVYQNWETIWAEVPWILMKPPSAAARVFAVEIRNVGLGSKRYYLNILQRIHGTFYIEINKGRTLPATFSTPSLNSTGLRMLSSSFGGKRSQGTKREKEGIALGNANWSWERMVESRMQHELASCNLEWKMDVVHMLEYRGDKLTWTYYSVQSLCHLTK